MEKREFPLFCSDDWLQIASKAFCAVVATLCLPLAHTLTERLVISGLIVFGLALVTWEYCVFRSRKIEISDEGLTVLSLPGKAVRIEWDGVSKCHVHSAARWTGQPFTAAVLSYPRGRALRIWGSCPDAAEILAILKQHLPESVFVTR